MAEMIKPKKEDIVVFGRIVSASTESVVADTRQVYDEKNSIRQNEINSKFLSGDYTINTNNISQDIWDKIKSEYLQLNGGNMTGAIRWTGSNLVAIGEDGINVNNNDYYVSIDPNKHDERGCINIEYDDTETLINNSNIKLRAKEGGSIKYSLILGDSDISMDAYTDNELQPVLPVFSVSSDEDEGDTFVHGIGFATFNQDNIGFLVNDGSVGLAISNSDIDGLFQQVFQTVIG